MNQLLLFQRKILTLVLIVTSFNSSLCPTTFLGLRTDPAGSTGSRPVSGESHVTTLGCGMPLPILASQRQAGNYRSHDLQQGKGMRKCID